MLVGGCIPSPPSVSVFGSVCRGRLCVLHDTVLCSLSDLCAANRCVAMLCRLLDIHVVTLHNSLVR